MVEKTIEYLHFTCDWIVTESEFGVFLNLFDVSEELGAVLFFRHIATIEGYEAERLVFRTPSENLLGEFIEREAKQIGLMDWHPISREEVFQHQYILNPQKYHYFYAWRDGIKLTSHNNFLLREKLLKNPPIFFACDWIVPGDLPSDWQERILRAHTLTGPFGSELRYATALQSKAGLQIQRIFARFYSQEELDQFVAEALKQPAIPHTWFAVSEQEYRQAIPFPRYIEEYTESQKVLDKNVMEASMKNKGLEKS